jgi:hypothetical protein
MFGKHTTVLITWNRRVGGLRGHALRFRGCFDHLEARLGRLLLQAAIQAFPPSLFVSLGVQH